MLSLKKCLTDIVNWCKSITTKIDNIGAFTINSADAQAIRVSTITSVISKRLPAGTYIITAALGWAIGNSSLTTAEYIYAGDAQIVAGYTSDMVSGGFYNSITCCVKLTTTTTIYAKQYWSGGSGTATNLASKLYTLRIS